MENIVEHSVCAVCAQEIVRVISDEAEAEVWVHWTIDPVHYNAHLAVAA